MIAALFVVLVILKLAGIIHISWWLVTLPLWIGLAIVFALIILSILGIGAGVGFMALLDKFSWRRSRRAF